MLLWLLIILWIGVAIMVVRSTSKLALGFKPRLVTLLAAILIIGSFLFQDWVRFDFAQYLQLNWDPLRDLLPAAAGRLGLKKLEPLLRAITGAASLNGWQLVLVPFFRWKTRLALLFPSIIALVTFLWLPFGSTYTGSTICKIVGGLLIILSLLALVGLAVAIPDVDALGVHDHIEWALLAVLLGVRIEIGPWLTMIGLLLLFAGGFIEITANRATLLTDSSQEVTWPS